ncbi:MAG: BatD family protein [Verrucomicrobiales bacterium]|nr:BatD family protein [Verrucomicrobiales bacterium]
MQISFASDRGEPVWVGQRITIIVEILAPTFFSSPTTFSLPNISGAVFYKPEERALVSSKNIEGQTYSVQRHEFSFYPQRAGVFEIPAFKVRFGVAGKLGTPASEHSELTKPLSLSAKMPPGAERLSVLISTTDLKVSESWNPQISGTATVGDAYKRTITFRAADMPGMVFPAISFPKIEGIKLYQARATVNDKINRGSLTGERIDTLTYLCEKPGRYVLPAIVIPWWNLNRQEMDKIVLPAVEFEVKAKVSSITFAEETQNPRAAFPWRVIAGLVAFIISLTVVFFVFKKTIVHKIKTWQKKKRESEAAYFKRVAAATTPAQTLNALTAWLARAYPNRPTLSLQTYASEQNDPELSEQIEILQTAVVSQTSQWDSPTLIAALRKTRRSQAAKDRPPALQRLNPRD